jgi:hypothetical protein
MSKSIHQKLPYKTRDKQYPPLPPERDTLASQPPAGAYDVTGSLLNVGDYPRDRAGNVTGVHDGSKPQPNGDYLAPFGPGVEVH